MLNGAAKSARVPNAYLFVGPDDRSLLNEALNFTRTLNNRDEDAAKIDAGIHPDILVVSPQGTSVKIDAVRDLTAFTRFGPAYAPWKIVVIHRADRMTEEAANAFLKTLEEPVRNVLFILTTSRENRVLRTIVSRCQKLYFDDGQAPDDAGALDLAEKLRKAPGNDIVSLFRLSDELVSLDDAGDSLSFAVSSMRRSMGDRPDSRSILALKEVFRAIRALELHGNKRLTMDNMLLSMREAYSN